MKKLDHMASGPEPDSGSPRITRRDFLRTAMVAGAGLALGRGATAADALLDNALPATAAPATALDNRVWVIHGADNRRLMARAWEIIGAEGGLGAQVKSVALKVNAGWTRLPEQGATTHPDLVEEFIKGCRATGVEKIVVPEHPCNDARQCFPRSGIQAVCERQGVPLIDLKTAPATDYQQVAIPAGKRLKQAEVARQFIEADALVNMPVAKHHGGSVLTMAMKNWMGAVRDRHFWHRNDLHQCIADFCTWVTPAWTLIDATRTMMDGGPQGPARVLNKPQLLVVARNQVCADAFTSTLFHDSPTAVRYLALAADMGLGTIDIPRLDIRRIEA